jgi:hypothetical protein
MKLQATEKQHVMFNIEQEKAPALIEKGPVSPIEKPSANDSSVP